MAYKQQLIKYAFSQHRKKSDEIYKGFGFRHLSDVTEYYVHHHNVSKNGTTTLCQPISEGIALCMEFLKSFFDKKPIGEFFYNQKSEKYFLEISIPQDWRDNGVFKKDVFRYRVFVDTHDIKLAAYNQEDNFIYSTNDNLMENYKICIVFLAILAKDYLNNINLKNDVNELLKNYTAENFVILCENFYQSHKYENQNTVYFDIKNFNTKGYHKFSETFDKKIDDLPENEPVKISMFSVGEFSAEQLDLIPVLSDEFVLDEKLSNLCNAVTSGDIRTILLHGPAGTGKTMSCKLICKAISLPIMETVNCTENLDEFVLGKFIPENGKIIFKESFVTKAIRDGGAVIFEEINFAKPQYLAFLNSLLDDNGFVRLDNGEIVRRHKNFRFFATMNVGYFGTKQLNQALYNRFNAIVEIAQLSETAIRRMLLARVPECRPMVEKVLNIYSKIKKKIETEELDIVVSPRNLENWVRLAKYEGYLEAAEKTIIPIAKCDRLLEETFRTIIKVYKWGL